MGLSATVVIVASLALSQQSPVEAQATCDRDSGPGGGQRCIRVAGYDWPQWGTCLSNDYIERKSRGHHECVESNATYCWYQCMIEVYNKVEENVTSDCGCNFTDVVDHNPNSLSHICFSPSGTECAWYRDCLEVLFACREISDNYVIAYDEKLCSLTQQRVSSTLSTRGQHWLDAARRCLMVELVPLLRPFESSHVTCDAIKSKSLKSHTSCYLNPYEGVPSLCDLSTSDFWTIFWAMRGEFSSIFIESLLGLIEVGKTCRSTDLLKLLNSMRKMTVVVNIQKLLQRRRRSTDDYAFPDSSSHERREIEYGFDLLSSAGVPRVNPKFSSSRVARQVSSELWSGETLEELFFHRLAAQTSSFLDTQISWGIKDAIVFSYGERMDKFLNVHILMADRHAFGLASNLYNPRPNLTELVEQTVQSLELGQIDLTLDGQLTPIISISGCSDLDCQSVYLRGNAPDGHTPSTSEGYAPSTSEGHAPSTSEGYAPSTSEGNAPGSSEGCAPGTSEGYTGDAVRTVGGWVNTILLFGVAVLFTKA